MSEQTLRIAVADDEPDMRDFFQKVLSHLGHEVVAVAENGSELVALCRETPPDLIITDIVMPEMDGLEAVREICLERPIPAILVSAHHDAELLDRALREQVLAYLVKPIKRGDLEPAIALAIRRFREFEALHHQATNLQQALEDRKLIERAKGILMKRAELDEPDAFRRLQKLSSDRNQKMVVIARTIVEAEAAFQT
ncbi:MAG: response regulator [Planctomycetaceae bacterium]|jgi:two-component system, response regulator PdtaR|nr:response regulator [Planctomycetaceae bacterium]MBT6153905.1 response regulator [Planctomycetaceae bacterium]MBT6486624.1 response regulator [Planctomycetaceae bacterium]MBT6496826.1 response regulator [Planctomycetaceae bacterium]